MTTDANLRGKEHYCNPSPQTALNAAQAPLLPDGWQAESWKPYPGLENFYEVSNTGLVREFFGKAKLKTHLNEKGDEIFYLKVHPYTGQFAVMQLKLAVAAAFLPNPKGYRVVRRKDRSDRRSAVSNLAWSYVPPPRTNPKQANTVAASPGLPYTERVLDRLLSEGKISQAEAQQAEAIPALDDCMSPLFSADAKLVVVPVSASDYDTLVGKVVAVVVKAKRFAYYLGRVVRISETEVWVSRDNQKWPDRFESRSVVASIARVVSVVEAGVN